jgi:hypothetical protein
MAPTISTDRLRAQIDCFNPEAKSTKEPKIVIKNLIEADHLEVEDLREALAENLPAEILFSWENMGASGAVGCRILRDLLVHRGVQYIQAPNRRIHGSLIDTIYPDPEERLSIVQIFDAQTLIAEQHQSSTNTVMQGHHTTDASPGVLPDTSVGYKNTTDATRAAHNLGLRFKQVEDKYSGEMSECLSEKLSHYVTAADDYELTNEQRLRFLHNIFTGESLRFYDLNVKGKYTTFSTAVAAMEAEFNSPTRQNRAKNYLKTIRISKVQATERLSTTDALDRIGKLITSMLPQCPRSHRSEAHKVEFLYQAVVGESWASAPLSRASGIDSDFQTLFTALHASLHQHHEEAAARKSDGFSYRSRTAFQTDILTNAGPSSPPRMFFQGQGRYANPRQP